MKHRVTNHQFGRALTAASGGTRVVTRGIPRASWCKRPFSVLVAIGAVSLLYVAATPASAQLVFVPSGLLTADGTIDYSQAIICVGETSSGSGLPDGYGYRYSASGSPYEGALNIQNNASVGDVLSYNASLVNMYSGTIGDHIAAYNSSTVNISGGNLPSYDGLYADNSSTVTISGTSAITGFAVEDDSTVNVEGGTVTNLGELNFSGNMTISGGTVTNARFVGSTANITGGLVSNAFSNNASVVNISGGTVDTLDAYDNSFVHVTAGGTLDDLYLYNSAKLLGTAGHIYYETIYDESSAASATFYGQSLTFASATTGLDPNGVTGVYYNMDWTQADGTVDDVDFFQAGGSVNNSAPTGVTFVSSIGSAASAPEPGTFVLIVPSLGVLAAGAIRRRRAN